MNCVVCGSRMVEQRVSFGACEHSQPLLVENVPAMVCPNCGEQVFSGPTVEVIKRIRDGQVPGPRLSYLHIYDFERAAQGQPTVEGLQAHIVLAPMVASVLSIGGVVAAPNGIISATYLPQEERYVWYRPAHPLERAYA